MSILDPEPAFPSSKGHPGMTLRDWFAGQALAGFLASDQPIVSYRSIAEDAYAFADAMMKARKSP